MQEKIQAKIDAIKRKAAQEGKPSEKYKTVYRSSLHNIIKTREQADAFMRLLRAETKVR